ncbi:hypothetical protein HanRHA438_Chr07g0317061 [Helianthus annuus]|nr:hypothetical protein HanIR_Chr07g0332511 [Helianthus annuus]KAJ0909031.1 hypothetical protein HanRHA438_Chr07g0317061 [Helianthus annuus]
MDLFLVNAHKSHWWYLRSHVHDWSWCETFLRYYAQSRGRRVHTSSNILLLTCILSKVQIVEFKHLHVTRQIIISSSAQQLNDPHESNKH